MRAVQAPSPALRSLPRAGARPLTRRSLGARGPPRVRSQKVPRPTGLARPSPRPPLLLPSLGVGLPVGRREPPPLCGPLRALTAAPLLSPAGTSLPHTRGRCCLLPDRQSYAYPAPPPRKCEPPGAIAFSLLRLRASPCCQKIKKPISLAERLEPAQSRPLSARALPPPCPPSAATPFPLGEGLPTSTLLPAPASRYPSLSQCPQCLPHRLLNE